MGEVLEIRDLRVKVEDKEILKGVNLTVEQGEVHALMGPNGSGKSTLAYSIMGHPGYNVIGGEVIWKGRNILELSADERSRAGLFLAFQYPVSIPGVTVANFLRTAINAWTSPCSTVRFTPLRISLSSTLTRKSRISSTSPMKRCLRRS